MNTGLITELTTYGNDYRDPATHTVTHSEIKKCKCDEVTRQQLFKIGIYDTFGRDYLSHIPFNLYHRPKQMVNVDPYKKIVLQELPKEDDSEVRRTRPRLIISPALSLDDAAEFLNEEELKLVLAYTYTSSWQKASKEAASPMSEPPAPDTTVEICSDPARSFPIPKPTIPEGWSKLGSEWDRFQLRNYCDPTAAFWKKMGPFVRPPVPTLDPEIKQKMDELSNRDALRLAHDDPIQGYAGYKPRDSSTIPLEKQDFSVTDVRLSFKEAENRRFKICAERNTDDLTAVKCI